MKDYSQILQSLEAYLEYLSQDSLCNPKVRDREDPTAWLLNQHELDQEYLYRLWKAGRITHAFVHLWGKALSELQAKADCDYFAWLMLNQPVLV